MITKKIKIAGIGCGIADIIYNRVSFSNPGFEKYISKQPGDGGLSPGKLVFTEELELFSGKTYHEILKDIVGDRPADVMNVGGPSLVSLILTSQILNGDDYEVKFYGMAGNDKYAAKIMEMVRQTPLNIQNYFLSEKHATPTTDVFSDPDYDNGHGERTFVNNIGAAWDFTPEQIGDEFYEADIVCFGGTALVPHIHDELTSMLKQARSNKCITLVNTVFDFRNQKKNPEKPWPLVESTDDYRLIDVLIMASEEALKISGQNTIEAAAEYFHSTLVSSFIITNGASDLFAGSNGVLFEKTGIVRFPVSRMIEDRLKSNLQQKGDTTGCGDNFAGGIITSLALQLKNKKKGNFSLPEAISWGVSSGGNCCFTVGGTYLETTPGEIKQKIQTVQGAYLNQIKNQHIQK